MRIAKSQIVCGLVALGLSLGITANAVAQSKIIIDNPADRSDLRCLTVIALAASRTTSGSDEMAGLTVVNAYYLGRLEGRTPEVDWLDRLGSYLTGQVEDDTPLKPEADRCVSEMATFGTRMTNWSQTMQTIVNERDALKN